MKRLLMSLAVVSAFVASSARAADDGSNIYRTRCAMCHGPDGKGTEIGKKMGSRALGASKLEASDIEKLVADGHGTARPLEDRLTAEQIKAVSAHVRTLK